jgi:hypothetical protein
LPRQFNIAPESGDKVAGRIRNDPAKCQQGRKLFYP